MNKKKKDIILKVKINNFDLEMQMDTGSEVPLLPKNSGNALTKILKNIVCYQDYISIRATNENELKKQTDIVLNRLKKTLE